MATLPLSFDYGYLAPDVDLDEVKSFQDNVDLAHKKVTQGGGLGSDYLGWVDPGKIVSKDEVKIIKDLARRIQDNSDALVAIGIGGSYLGARAVIEAVGEGKGPAVLFAGNSLSAHEHQKVLNAVAGKRFSINAISKSGTTTEPAVAFRLFRDALERSVGKAEAKGRIVATTDAKKGALRKFAEEEGYATLTIADDVGGRYSVLSPVGLLPIAVAGIDIDALLQGAKDVAAAADNPDVTKNPSYFYAAARNLLYRKGYVTEIFASFEPRLHYIAEWWKQLTGESEGKDHISLFPASVDLTTDLHSMGQWIQQGRRNIIETFVILDGGEPNLKIPGAENDLDELGYLQGKSLFEVNHAAYQATALAHRDGGVPNSTVHLTELNAYTLGALLYFFERAIGVSGYLMGINPFNQPGVEAYKTNMFALLGKPKYEQATKDVQGRLGQQKGDTTVTFG
ncbi:MAG: glucose-6-phosphate isomerase [Armatimonadetes bacterium]|nr:glucose-6-phosphate isomerase [Armatimonadota bacterium]